MSMILKFSQMYFIAQQRILNQGSFISLRYQAEKNQLSELVDFFRVPNINAPLKFGDIYTTETQIDSNKIFAGYNNLHYDNPIINYIIDYYDILKINHI